MFVPVIMPPSALDQLTRLNVVYPMLFKLTNSKKSRITHAGVLEFVADEGKIYIPYWVRIQFVEFDKIIFLMKDAANKLMIALNLFVELNFIKQCNQLCFANFIMLELLYTFMCLVCSVQYSILFR